MSLRELVSTLFIYKSTIIFMTALVGGGALIFSYCQPEIYEASVQVWAQDQSVGLRKASGFSSETAARIKMVLTNLREVMLSNEVLQATLQRCGVTADATTGDAAAQPGPSEPPDSPPRCADEQLDKLRKAIRIEAPKGSDFGATQIFFLRVRDADPAQAKQLLEALLASFRERFEQLSAEQAKHLHAETSRQVDKSRGQLKDSEQAMETFVAGLGAGLLELTAIGTAGGGESELRKGLNSVSERLVPAQAELKERVAFLDQLQRARASSNGPLVVPGLFVRDYPALEQSARSLGETRLQMDIVAARTTASHPEHQTMQDRLGRVEQTYRTELERAVQAMQREIAAKSETVEYLTQQKDGYVARLAELAGKYVEYDGLKEEVRQRRAIVEEAERRRSDAAHTMLTAAQEVLLSTVDPPRAGPKPVSPQRKFNTVVGTLLGLLIGVGLAFLAREYSQTVRSEADLLGLGDGLVVVSVPKVRNPLRKVA